MPATSLAQEVIEARAAAGLSAGVAVVQASAGAEHQGVLFVRHLGGRRPVDGPEDAQAAGEATVLVQAGGAGVLLVGARPLQAVVIEAVVLYAVQGRGQLADLLIPDILAALALPLPSPNV